MKSILELKDFLDEQAALYNQPNFIEDDPISIPHLFSKKEDQEIAGFIAAILAWGQRKTILKNCRSLFTLMDLAPHDFIKNHTIKDRKPFKAFVHRTFNGIDLIYFLAALQQIYQQPQGLEGVFMQALQSTDSIGAAISEWKKLFFTLPHQLRTEKHFADPLKNSSAKRICMYLRWMIRQDKNGVDFGIWKQCSPSILNAPLDIHSGRVARHLGLLERKQDDWKAVVELSDNLRLLNPTDPCVYDFALFGIGVNEKNNSKLLNS